MNLFIILAFLFYIGSSLGWVLELFYRRFFSSQNPERKWVNPGFLVGPCVPLYGFGLCIVYLLASAESRVLSFVPAVNMGVMLLCMGLFMTLLELAAGELLLRFFNMRLWDYQNERFNYKGLICLRFSIYWTLLSAFYYFFVHRYVLGAIEWLFENLALSFFIGMFFGFFIVDLAYSSNIVFRVRAFAEENELIVRYEHFKSYIRAENDRRRARFRFLVPFRSDRPLRELLSDYRTELERRVMERAVEDARDIVEKETRGGSL